MGCGPSAAIPDLELMWRRAGVVRVEAAGEELRREEGPPFAKTANGWGTFVRSVRSSAAIALFARLASSEEIKAAPPARR